MKVKTDYPNFYSANTRFAVFKMDYPNIYKPPTRSVVIKTDSPNIYKPPTQFVVVKTDSPLFYKPPTSFTDVKTDTLQTSKSLLRAFSGIENGLSESLRVSYMLYGGQMVL